MYELTRSYVPPSCVCEKSSVEGSTLSRSSVLGIDLESKAPVRMLGDSTRGLVMSACSDKAVNERRKNRRQ